jgi:hypothetical protein
MNRGTSSDGDYQLAVTTAFRQAERDLSATINWSVSMLINVYLSDVSVVDIVVDQSFDQLPKLLI